MPVKAWNAGARVATQKRLMTNPAEAEYTCPLAGVEGKEPKCSTAKGSAENRCLSSGNHGHWDSEGGAPARRLSAAPKNTDGCLNATMRVTAEVTSA